MTIPGRLLVDGTPMKKRYLIVLDGVAVHLRGKSFRYLFMLAAARWLHDDGWIHKNDIEPGNLAIRYMHQLRKELDDQFLGSGKMIENVGTGQYRITPRVSIVSFNLERLHGYPDYDVVRICSRLESILHDRTIRRPDYKGA